MTTNNGTVYLVRNETPTSNHWLGIKLVGHKSNRDGIGAEIKLTTSKGTQFVTVSTAGSYLSANDKRAHFGLLNDAAAQSIEIRSPSGTVQTLKKIPETGCWWWTSLLRLRRRNERAGRVTPIFVQETGFLAAGPGCSLPNGPSGAIAPYPRCSSHGKITSHNRSRERAY